MREWDESFFLTMNVFFNIQPIHPEAMEGKKRKCWAKRKNCIINNKYFFHLILAATKSNWNNIGNMPDMHNLMKTRSDAVQPCVNSKSF